MGFGLLDSRHDDLEKFFSLAVQESQFD